MVVPGENSPVGPLVIAKLARALYHKPLVANNKTLKSLGNSGLQPGLIPW